MITGSFLLQELLSSIYVWYNNPERQVTTSMDGNMRIIKNPKVFIPALAAVILFAVLSAGCTFTEPAGKEPDSSAPQSKNSEMTVSLPDYIKTAERMNWRHIGGSSYTTDVLNREAIDLAAGALTAALPNELDLREAEIDNESVIRDYWEQGSCVELVFAGDYDRMLVCFTKDEDVLFLSQDGAYQYTLGPLDAAALEPVYDWVRTAGEMVASFDGGAEILGHKLTVYKNPDLEQVVEYKERMRIQAAMSRSVAFYQAAQLRQYEMINSLATANLQAEIEKWGNNAESKAGDIMSLANITDVAFPVSVAQPVFSDPDRFLVILGLDKKTTAEVELIITGDGTVLVDAFEIVTD